MKHLKWGFIGCGEVTEKKSGPAFSEVAGSSVVAVMSRTEQHARTYAISHGIKNLYAAIESCHLCHHGHEGWQTRLRREAAGCQL